MDLSKAFDCLPHNILLCKLSSYGFTENATKLMESYLSDRKQQIKIGNVVSSWAEIKKRSPLRFNSRPLLFNVFINDIFYFINNCDLYNYADDNTLSFHSPDFDEILRVLQSEGKILIDCFCFNCMQANPNKFQAIAVGKRTHEKSPTFNFGSINITYGAVVELLGIDIDFRLSFDNHISNICKKETAQQLGQLKRIGNRLSRLKKSVNFSYIYFIQFQFLPTSLAFLFRG